MLTTVAAGLVTGSLLGALGGGGSVLLVPLLVVVFGLDAHMATGTALGVVAVTSVAGAALHARTGDVRLRDGLLFATPGMLAAAAMGRVNPWIPEGYLLGTVVALMALVGVWMWVAPKPVAERRSSAVILMAGLTAGGLTGLLGVGGGFLVVPALVLALGLPMGQAVGTSLVVIAANALAALPGFMLRGDVDVALALVLAGAALVGVFTGARVVRMVGERVRRQTFAALLVAMACVTVVHAGFGPIT